jgi:nitrite reductase (NADH) small subunit
MAHAARKHLQRNPRSSPGNAFASAKVDIEISPPLEESQAGASSMQPWTRICRVDEIPRLGARVVRRAGAPNVAVFRTAGDRLFALLDSCPHRGGPLSQGIVYGERVACPLHNTSVELESGAAVAPDKGCVARFPVKVTDGNVYVDLRAHSDE